MAYLEPHAGQVISHTLSSQAIHHLHLDFPFTLGQQLVANPVLVSKVAGTALVGVVFAQDALQPVAAMMPACMDTLVTLTYGGVTVLIPCRWTCRGLVADLVFACMHQWLRLHTAVLPISYCVGGLAGIRLQPKCLHTCTCYVSIRRCYHCYHFEAAVPCADVDQQQDS